MHKHKPPFPNKITFTGSTWTMFWASLRECPTPCNRAGFGSVSLQGQPYTPTSHQGAVPTSLPHRGGHLGSSMRLASPAHMAASQWALAAQGFLVLNCYLFQWSARRQRCQMPLMGFCLSQFQWQRKYQARLMVQQGTKETSCCHIRESEDDDVLIK